MSYYNNIFHYYRGQTRNSSEEVPFFQLENNVTKAFLNVLEHASNSLFESLCNELGLTSTNEKPSFHFQVATKLQKNSVKGIVLAIAKDRDVILSQEENKRYTIADGAICSSSVSIVLEVKIRGDRLYESQLRGHQKLLTNSKFVIPKHIVRTWDDIFNFLSKELKKFEQQGDSLSYFLINQFLEFCNSNCIAKDKLDYDDVFRQFPTERERHLARDIHHYIMYHKDWKQDITTSIPKRGDCIEYKIKPPKNFLTLLADDRVRGLIVRRNLEGGLTLQNEIDRFINIPFDRTGFNKKNEAYIRFDFWKDDLSKLFDYIDGTN